MWEVETGRYVPECLFLSSRDEAKRILEASSPCNGYCVVRENARVKGGFSLSVWNDASVRHYLVELHSNGYGIQDGLRFATVHKLLEHYKIDRVSESGREARGDVPRETTVVSNRTDCVAI